ncbi:MAG: efflux RND transporter permease subunit [Chlamydiota bacterium]|nr:efflux RND transporter permease subunit [Chlamydiota bacterium]
MGNGTDDLKNSPTGPIAWMARNRVTANLCMLIFVVGGIIFASRIKQEVFPEVELDIVQVSVIYPAASPSEVELGILLSIEDEVLSLDGVKRVTSIAVEDRGIVQVELLQGSDPSKILQDVKNRIDSIKSFPEDAERPIVQLLEPRRQVISLIVYGDQDTRTLRQLAENIHDQLIQLPKITLVEVTSVPDYEIAVEVALEQLRNNQLTLEEIADIIRRTAVTIPAGGVKTPSGEVLLRTQERRDFAREFFDIPIITNPNGSNVLLGEIADLRDTFSETDEESYYNGKKAIKIDVFRVGDQTPLEVSGEVNDFVEKFKTTLPEGVDIATWNDRSEVYKDRINLLVKNAQIGLLLVLILLALFLEPRLAFWVTLGIPVSIIGSFIFIPLTGATINMVSLFAFIVTLGIIVDDAIVVGENIYQKREQGMSYLKASIVGAREISVPVVFSVLTNIAAFLPLFFIPGSTGKIFLQIPSIVISVFLISLVESLYILPAHLSKKHRESKLMAKLRQPSRWVDRWFKKYTETVFKKQLRAALKHRYITVSSFVGIFIVFLGLVLSGFIPFSYLPRVDSDLVTSQVVLPFGVPISQSRQVQEKLVEAVNEVLQENGGSGIAKGVYSQIGSPLGAGGPALDSITVAGGAHLVGVQVFLVSSDLREISGVEFARKWKEKVGDIPGIESINFDATIQSGEGMPISIELSHPSEQELEFAAREMAEALSTYKGVSEIDDGVSKGKPQLSFKIKPTARSLGLTAGDLARQVRSAFYGAEALRQQRGRDEVKVLVKFPKKERESLEIIEKLVILTPNGGEIPFSEAVDVESGRAYTDIKRADGRRVLAITSDVDESVANANQIVADIQENVIPKLENKYRGLTYTLQGQLRAQKESLDAMGVGFLVALVAIYVMLAIPFKSYIQPFIVMLSIPFGAVGAVIGHMLLGYELSIISIFGLVALTGVVVNDSLVLVVTTNRIRRKSAVTSFDALMSAAVLRFRPILLTSLTTFFGLSPMIFERSMQARFLIPMAISLGFGVLFGTFIILLVVPATYLIIVDIKKGLKLYKDTN